MKLNHFSVFGFRFSIIRFVDVTKDDSVVSMLSRPIVVDDLSAAAVSDLTKIADLKMSIQFEIYSFHFILWDEEKDYLKKSIQTTDLQFIPLIFFNWIDKV